MREKGKYVTINSTGFTFSADAIRESSLEEKNSVVILQDSEDPYIFAFKFFIFQISYPRINKISIFF